MTARDETLANIQKYVKTTGRRWFTYDSFQDFVRKRKLSRYKVETISRTLRRLADEGILKKQKYKRNGKKAVIFLYDV